ncbi:DENN domain-containing protein [Oopsacas minuta]|uniref:DENN domain-containing protein n=1 Tax=Oopsacas minuta TaxID=111878 RepID=A0AAV7KP74_9METZ|nr:DENN domain-containing protein [Oopsacas minuta]
MDGGHLLNGLVAACVFSGADQYSKLEAISDGDITPTNIYETECRPKILGLFDPISTVLPYYPPSGLLGDFSQLRSNTSKCSHSISSLPPEMINSLSEFIYPDGFYVWGYQCNLPQPTFSYIVLTDIDGDRNFCVNVTFWRRFHAQKCLNLSQLCYELTLGSHLPTCSATSVEICVPLCVTLISRVPLFQTMRECLSSIVSDLNNCKDIYSVLQNFNSILTLIPSPPSGSLALHFTLNDHFIILPGLSQDYPHCDSHLFWPFFSLSTENILKVFGYILTQQNIVFTSNNYNLLALTMQCFCHYLFPFEWRLTFAPLLPKRLLGILDSPTTFLCGCHTFSMKEVDLQELRSIIFVSLDKGTITCTDDLTLDNPSLTFPSFYISRYHQPIDILFKRRCHSFHTMDIAATGNLMCEKTLRVEWEADMDHQLINLIMSMLTEIFQDIPTYVTYPSEFNSEGFQRGLLQDFKPFYEAVLETDVFNQLIKQLLNKLKTPFTQSLDDIKKKKKFDNIQEPIDPMSSFVCISMNEHAHVQTEYVNMHHRLCDTDIGTTRHQSIQPSFLELPPFPNSPNSNPEFFTACVDRINAHIKTSSAPCRAECIYLRGYYLLALGNPLKAMEDFLSHLSKINVNLVPSEDSLIQIYSNLSEQNKNALRKMPYFSRSIFEMEHEVSLSRRLSQAKFPIQTLTRDEFELHLSTNGISANSETCSILFSVLTHGGTIIAPDKLKQFSECWSLVRKINSSLQHNSKIEIPTKEQIVYCSCDKPVSSTPQQVQQPPQPTQLVKYHNTQGHLLITEHNVWLLQLDNKIIHLFKFTHVSTFLFTEVKEKQFQKMSHAFGIKIQPTTEIEELKSIRQGIDRIYKKSIYHSLRFYDKKACVFFIECFKEMHAAHALVQKRKDEAYLGEGKLNVLLLATLLKMSIKTLNSDSDHDPISQAIKQGLFYLHKTQIESREIDNNNLLYRFNPLSTDTQKASIEVLLCINDKQVQNQIFWIGYVYQRESIICIYDYQARVVVSEFILHDQRVEAIVEVGAKVWLSSLNKSLYIVNKDKYTIDGRLSEPNDVAVAFHYDAQPSELWVLYHKGQIVVWDTRSLEQKRTIFLNNTKQDPSRYSSMVIYQNYIFTYTSRSILVFEKDLGELVSTLYLTAPDTEKPIEARGMCISDNRKIWVAGIREPILFVIDPTTLKFVKILNVNENSSSFPCNGINSILSVGASIWLGGRNGCIYIYEDEDYSLRTFFKAHQDSIRSLAVTRSQSIVTSGSNSLDGRVSFWST